MHFTYLEAENFMSIGSVKMDLDKRGLIVVIGENNDDPSAASNGSGKSALIESIYWCLYGSTLRGVKYVDSVVNRQAKKNCRVKVTLQTKVGFVTIERFRKHKEHKNAVHVFLNDQPQHATDPRTTQHTINNFLDMDSDAFARLVLIGQGFSLRFTSMSDRELKEFIEGLTGSILYAKANSAAKDNLDAAKIAKVSLASEADVFAESARTLNEQTTQEKDKVLASEAERTERVNQFETANATNQSTLRGLREAVAKMESEKASNVSQYDGQVSEWDAHIESLRTSLRGVTTQQDAWRVEHRQAEKDSFAAVDAAITALKAQHENETVQLSGQKDSLVQARNDEVQHDRESRGVFLLELSQFRKPQEAEYEALRLEVDSFRTPTVEPSLHANFGAAKARLESHEKRVAAAEEKVGTNCPACGQPVTGDSVNEHILHDSGTELNDIENVIKACEKALEDAGEKSGAEALRQDNERVRLQDLYEELQKVTVDHQSQVASREEEANNIPAKHEEGIRAVDLQIAELRGKQTADVEAQETRRHEVSQQFSEAEANQDIGYSVARETWDVQIRDAEKSRVEVQGVRDKYVRDTDTMLNQNRGQMTAHEQSIASNNTEIAKLKAKDFQAVLQTLEDNSVALEKKIVENAAKTREASETEFVYDYLTFAFGLGGIRSYMMDSILSYLNERLKVYCQSLFDGMVFVELSPVREQKNKSVVDKISLIVTTNGGSYDTSSGGERRKVDMALFLAFRDLNRKLNPVQVNLEAYDEILSFLDSEAASRVVQLLVNDQSVDTKILITHRSDVPIIGPHQILKAVRQMGVTSYVTA